MDDEIKCLCKKLSDANCKITQLECRNFSLEKENERLSNRIDLLENRPFPRHYDYRISSPTGFGERFCRLDMYTLERIYSELKSMVDNYPIELHPTEWYKIEVYKGILHWLWDKMDVDSKDWLTKSRDEYYGDSDGQDEM